MMLMTKKIAATRGNEYIPIENSQMVNKYYDYTVSVTVFTSMLKLCRLLRLSMVNITIISSISFILVSKKPSDRLLQLSSFVSSAFLPLWWSLSLFLDLSAASFSLFSVQISGTSSTSPPLLKIQLLCPLGSSTSAV